MSAEELLLSALDQRYEKYLIEYKHCRDEFSEEAVHQLRVTARRLLALIELLQEVTPSRELLKLRRTFKDQLDSLDDLRDTQVMLTEIASTLKTLPELARVYTFLQKREKRLLTRAEFIVSDYKIDSLTSRMGNARKSLAKPVSLPDMEPQLMAVVDNAWKKIKRRASRVDPAQPASIHRVRVVFKKFRYMVEIIHPLLPGFPEDQLKLMHAYQTAMGEIQDVEVFLGVLADFPTRHTSYDPRPVRHFYELRHTELITTYIKNKSKFLIFWRKKPKNPFPWETKEKDKQ
ncbi:MAG: CHAD domain-containing protein [Chloroflexota bacterium]